ncbi:cellulase family glycosylhydrolase [Jiangella alba]|uniref:Ig-like domain (Group 3) n=1 Tax=Jiangella alba TaxID=561176 RepID=A0A1H5HKT9_9ACTN|nr:Ig-like domain-containing protein [Jiangella alba]SEE28405.1 Ig-like domain (group 3) [Jiangella alba]
MIRKSLRSRSALGGAAALTLVTSLLGGLVASAAETREDPAEPLPRIAAGEHRQLVDTETGRPFIPRGYNYVRLAPQPWNPEEPYHSTFEPGQYDGERAGAALAEQSAAGYNTVRVFVDPGHGQDNLNGTPHGLGHGDDDTSTGNAEYLDNLADFVRRAAANGMYVLPSLDAFPQNAHYFDIVAQSAPPENVSGRNTNYMYEGFVAAKEAYLANFTTEMTDRLGPLMSTFLALQLDNEATFAADEAPFAQASGTFTAPDGTTYDMSVPEQRQAAADDTIVAYADAATAAAKEVDPDLMVTMGAFTNRAVGKPGYDGFATHCAGDACEGDFRYPARVSTLTRESALDFFDIHTYPTPQYTLEESLNSVEWPQVEGVVINGEFGAQRDRYGDDIGRAAEAMRAHQVESCAFELTGWLFWTWDTDEDDVQRLFFRGNEDGGVIDRQLSPVNRPDPCLHEAPVVAPLAVESPEDGQTGDVEFAGTGQPGGTVTLTVDDEALGSATVADDGRWSLAPDADLPVGVRFDALLTQVVRLDYQDVVVADLGVPAPGVTIDEPSRDAGQVFAGGSYPSAELEVTLTADAGRAAIEGSLDRDDDGDWTFTPADELAAGDYTLTATASAGDGGDPELLGSDASVTVTVESSDDGGDGGDGDASGGSGESGGESGGGSDGGAAGDGSGEDLPDTGGPGAGVLLGAVLLLAAGGVLVARTRGRTATR